MENILRVLKVVKRVKTNDGVSPMTYAKLKELGYESKDWQNWSDEEKVKRSQEGGKGSGEKSSNKETKNVDWHTGEEQYKGIAKLNGKYVYIYKHPSGAWGYATKKFGAPTKNTTFSSEKELNNALKSSAEESKEASEKERSQEQKQQGKEQSSKENSSKKSELDTLSEIAKQFNVEVKPTPSWQSKYFITANKHSYDDRMKLANKLKSLGYEISGDGNGNFYIDNTLDEEAYKKSTSDWKIKEVLSQYGYNEELSDDEKAFMKKVLRLKDSINVDDALTDEEIDQLIKEEEDAIASYEAALKVAVSPVAKDRLQHILEEEQEHVQELRALKAQPTHDAEKDVYEIKNEAGHYVVYKNNIRFVSCDSFSEAVKEIKDDGGNA